MTGSNGSPAAVQGIKETERYPSLTGFEARGQLEESERSHFVTLFGSLQLLLGCS